MYLLVIAGLVLLVGIALRLAVQRDLRRKARAEPQLSEACRAGFALTDAINICTAVEAAARQAAQAALEVCCEIDREPRERERARRQFEIAIATADSAAEHAAVQARIIRLHHADIMRACESSPLKMKLLDLAGSEAMEYRVYAEIAASSLDEAADQARSAAAQARERCSGLRGS